MAGCIPGSRTGGRVVYPDGSWSASGAYHRNDCRCQRCVLPRIHMEPPASEHPTILEIAQRETEILRWDSQRESLRRTSRKMRRLSPVPLFVTALSIYLFINAKSAWLCSPALLVAVSGLLAFLWMALPGSDEPIQARPYPLQIVKFTSIENDYLISRQEEESFRALCTCPGCGKVDVHLIAPAPEDYLMKSWAKVFRACEVCDRMWLQS